jgi:hypothetical protein
MCSITSGGVTLHDMCRASSYQKMRDWGCFFGRECGSMRPPPPDFSQTPAKSPRGNFVSTPPRKRPRNCEHVLAHTLGASRPRDVRASKYYHGNSEMSCDKNVLSTLGWVWKSCLQKGVGLGKVGPSWRGSFEIEKYEDALHMTWRVTPRALHQQIHVQ